MSVIVLSEALFMPLMMGALWFVLRAFSAQKRVSIPALGFGVCSGLAVLARPSWLLFIPFLAVVACVLVEDRHAAKMQHEQLVKRHGIAADQTRMFRVPDRINVRAQQIAELEICKPARETLRERVSCRAPRKW